MRVLLAVLAIVASVSLLGWIGLRDPKRLRAQKGEAMPHQPFSTPQRRLLAFAAALPGLVLMLTGWWSSAVMWLGATATLVWLCVLWLGRPRARLAAAVEQAQSDAQRSS